MKVSRPDMIGSGDSKLTEAVEKFEEELAQEDQDQDYFFLVIVGEYNRDVCNKIEELYTQAGWKEVSCKTSSENGERPGLTGLKFHRPKNTFVAI